MAAGDEQTISTCSNTARSAVSMPELRLARMKRRRAPRTLSVGEETSATCLNDLPEDLSQFISHRWESTTDAIAFLRVVVSNGGPTSEEHDLLTSCFLRLWKDGVPFDLVRDVLQATISSPDCMQGFGFLKPHGYAGDFEMIDRIYTFWKSQHPTLRRWDEYFHLQPAPRAVRNRKAYFHELLRKMKRRVCDDSDIHVLNLGSGPGRDIYEYLPESSQVIFDCIDLDQKAIDFAKILCSSHARTVTFHRKNVLRLRLSRQYDLIWCAGLFDYFGDRMFVKILRQLTPHISPNGELVIGNFSKHNFSRYWMEAVGDWRLYHRREDDLIALGQEAGIEIHRMHIGIEPERVNLFLHVAG